MSPNRPSVFLLAAALGIAVAGLHGETLVLPVEAIADSARMSAAEFVERHPGIDLAGGVPETEGYYIRYRHENLVYLFGPVADRTEANRWRLELEVIRDRAVEARASLRTSTIDVFEFRWDAVAAGAPTRGATPAPDQPPRAARAESPGPIDPAPARTDSAAPRPPADPAAPPTRETAPPSPADPASGPPGDPRPSLWTLIRRIFTGR